MDNRCNPGKARVFSRLMEVSPRELGKCLAYAVFLLAPGSFVVLPVFWLVRRFALQR